MPHIHHKLDLCSEVFIVYDDKVLLRKHDKLKLWLSVGGHIEDNEDPCEAAVREVREEVGLDVQLYDGNDTAALNTENWKLLPRPICMNRHRITDTHDHVAFVFFAKAKTDRLELSKTEKSDDCRWFSIEELEKDTQITLQIKYYARKALETLRGKTP